MTGSSVNLKIFLRDGDNTEIRRLTIDANVATSFLYLKEKLQTLLPGYTDFKVTWKDSDNDEVSICCDEDLITAFTEMNSDLKVLYVSGDQDSTADNDDGKKTFPQGKVQTKKQNKKQLLWIVPSSAKFSELVPHFFIPRLTCFSASS